ncbi:hypothetical protein [Phytohabitans suffuscus]
MRRGVSRGAGTDEHVPVRVVVRLLAALGQATLFATVKSWQRPLWKRLAYSPLPSRRAGHLGADAIVWPPP